jgi:hypothetical protein
MPQPSQRTFDAFKVHFFNGEDSDPMRYPILGGHSANLLDDLNDLLTLKIPEHEDRLTRFVQNYLGCLFRVSGISPLFSSCIELRQHQTGRKRGSVIYISDKAISAFATWLGTLLAATLLIGATVSLYVVESPNKKLGMIAAFTTLFAASVGLLSNARRAEVFGATAA